MKKQKKNERTRIKGKETGSAGNKRPCYIKFIFLFLFCSLPCALCFFNFLHAAWILFWHVTLFGSLFFFFFHFSRALNFTGKRKMPVLQEHSSFSFVVVIFFHLADWNNNLETFFLHSRTENWDFSVWNRKNELFPHFLFFY